MTNASPNWSDGFATPLILSPNPSRTLHSYLLVLHAAALWAAWAAALDLAVQLFACVLIGALYLHWRRLYVTGHAPRAITRIDLDGAGWRLYFADGSDRRALLLPGCYVTPWLIVLRFASGRRRAAAVLPADALDADQHRRLRVRLLWDHP